MDWLGECWWRVGEGVVRSDERISGMCWKLRDRGADRVGEGEGGGGGRREETAFFRSCCWVDSLDWARS